MSSKLGPGLIRRDNKSGGYEVLIGIPHSSLSSGAMAYGPGYVYQHIYDVAAKRISTLDYLRKAYVICMGIPSPRFTKNQFEDRQS